MNSSPVRTAAKDQVEGLYNSKKGCPAMSYRDTNHLKSTFQRELWSEVGIWMQERAQTLWDGGMPDEAAALYSEFARGPALVK